MLRERGREEIERAEDREGAFAIDLDLDPFLLFSFFPHCFFNRRPLPHQRILRPL